MIDEEEYFRLIEAHFLQKRGNPMLLSPKEWALIREWFETGIPSEVVLRGIDRAYEKKKDGEEKDIASLMYCKRIVKSEHKRYLKSLEGAAGAEKEFAGPAAEDISTFLQLLSDNLKSSSKLAGDAGNGALADLLLMKSVEIKEKILEPYQKHPEQDRQRVENQLTTIEKEIEQVIMTLISEEQLMRFKEDAMRDLKDFEGKLDFVVYQEMLRRSLIKSLRKIYNIPRLSLFYM